MPTQAIAQALLHLVVTMLSVILSGYLFLPRPVNQKEAQDSVAILKLAERLVHSEMQATANQDQITALTAKLKVATARNSDLQDKLKFATAPTGCTLQCISKDHQLLSLATVNHQAKQTIAQLEFQVAQLEDRLSECNSQLVASRRAGYIPLKSTPAGYEYHLIREEPDTEGALGIRTVVSAPSPSISPVELYE